MAVRWGLVTTAKAPARDILNFVAHHVDIGAARIHLFLDEPCPEAEAALASEPAVEVTLCDAAYWKMRRPRQSHPRPPHHRGRQFANANWAYKHTDLDWIAHIDIDEYLISDKDLSSYLHVLPEHSIVARMHPLEVLDTAGQDLPRGRLYAKGAHRSHAERLAETNAIYPTYGPYLNGGFLSHQFGKIFVRCGLKAMKIKIHLAFQHDVPIPGLAKADLDDVRLLHFHAADWDDWLGSYRYRLKNGVYRPGTPAANPKRQAARGETLTIHDVFRRIEDERGTAGLRAFWEEVCLATPDLRARLAEHGHLHEFDLDLDAVRLRRFGPLTDEQARIDPAGFAE